MTYTINGKEWTEFDINTRCAELLGYNLHFIKDIESRNRYWNALECITHTDAIIDKCWGELMSSKDERGCGTWTHWDHVKWQRLMNEHNCTKLIAACICYIEMQEEI
jgi:hypothetical protein